MFCEHIENGCCSKAWCEQRFNTYFQNARDSLMRAWSVLDILRSITIAPRYRIQFIEQLVNDVLSMLLNVSSLYCCCEWCSNCCAQFTVDFIDLEDRIAAMRDTFDAVCADQRCGEESLIATLIQKTECLAMECDRVVKGTQKNNMS